MFSKKGRKLSPTGSHVGAIFESELSSVEQKRGSRICLEKWYPPRRKQDSIHRPGGSWRRRLACAFSTTKTAAWTATATTTATIAKTAARVQLLFEIVARIRLFLDVAVPFQVEELFELLHLLQQKLVI